MTDLLSCAPHARGANNRPGFSDRDVQNDGPMRNLVLIAGRSHPDLARATAESLGVGLLQTDIRTFANGEIYTRFNSSVRGKDVFVLQTGCDPVNDGLVELLLLIDSCKRASAKHISAVTPCYPYSRQDRKGYGREPISARLVADLIACAGADRIITVDLHASQIQGFFNGPVDHLTGVPALIKHVKSLRIDNLTIVSPDIGRVKVADVWSDKLNAPLAIIHKRRDPRVHNNVTMHEIVGDVRSRVCLVVDDLIDTGDTLAKAAIALKSRSRKSNSSCNPWDFSTPERLVSCGEIDHVIVTDSVPASKVFDRVKTVSPPHF